ncbi:MAG TPA: NnrS family protein [Stellaceae bacterium]
MSAIPRYRPQAGPAIWSAGFRPFFLAAALWAALAVPLWLALYGGEATVPTALSAAVWHAHEMIFGYAAAAVAGFLLTAIPNWTGRMPLQGGPLVALVALWALGRIAVLSSARIGAPVAMACDLAFPLVFLAAVAREIVAGRNWRNLPMVGALSLLLAGNFLVHLAAVGLAPTGDLGNRIGLATLLMLISFVGGRLIPSFTRNWLAKERPEVASPAPFGRLDRAVLAVTAVALALWAVAPEASPTPWVELAAGLAIGIRLARWHGRASWREPLVWVLHLGYLWLALGLLLLGFNGLVPVLPPAAALHALTVGAVGTMTLAVMTRASLGHTGRGLSAGPGTTAIYVMVTIAAVLRLAAPLAGASYLLLLWFAGAAWSAAFGLFVLFYAGPLASPRATGAAARPI